MCRSNVDINSSIATLACIVCSRSFVQDSFVNVPHSRGEGRRSGYPRTLPAQFLKSILYVLQWAEKAGRRSTPNTLPRQDRSSLQGTSESAPSTAYRNGNGTLGYDRNGRYTINLCDSSNIK